MSFSRRKFLRASGLMTTAALLSVEQLLAAIEKNQAVKGWDSGSSKQSIINDLRSKGYSLIPAPQQLKLTGNDIVVDKTWAAALTPGKGARALSSLHTGVASLHSLNLAKTGANRIVLELKAGTIKEKLESSLLKQAYHLQISPNQIRIAADDEAGLFYGVQSLLQLLRPEGNGSFKLPEGSITDWPALDLRFIHWDTKHHQDRMETLKRYMDWAALFKINMIAFEIEDKYEYPRHPIIGAPGAFTKKEMHELTAYAHARYIQLVPNVQAPAHMAYVLKHKEFEHLKSDGSNYQACMCDEEAMNLILDMYQDMIDATPGVNYFFVSTDEVYYAGMCAKCQKEYNEENRSQMVVDYINRVHKWFAERGRRILCWVEYPILPKHIVQLPADLIDGIMSTSKTKDWVDNQNKVGIKQLAYSSMQGAEYLFPGYFGFGERAGRLDGASKTVTGSKAMGAELIGTFAAAWDDSGLHNEAFWLGWATVAQYAWTATKPSIEQTVADFMDIYYGHNSPDMVETYRLLEKGGRFYHQMWDHPVSKERGPGYGNSHGKGIGTKRTDETLDMPPIPSGIELRFEPAFAKKYEKKIAEAKALAEDMNKLAGLLQQNISKVHRNKYNLEVFLSIAYLERYSVKTFPMLARAEAMLESAVRGKDKPANAVNQLIGAHKAVGALIAELDSFWPEFTAIWEKSRFKKCRSVNGKHFVHVLDDVKDHFADRRLGLEYMTAPFERMEMKKWREELWNTIAVYAKANNVPIAEAEETRLED
ncbi:MAG TPA: beta-N-acetylhexosaminidase [Flavitalea sp.]|nr:beta-N-acetylhexosaminidase [Flavitalea sp.]